jgi:hypothetical protein
VRSGAGPTGRARAELRLESSNLIVDTFRLFNRGVEVRASGVVHDLWKLPRSQITGYAVGSARPLHDLKLPFMADVDAVFSAIQGSVATVRVDGTVHEPKPRIATFDEVESTLRAMLLGDVRSERSSQ